MLTHTQASSNLMTTSHCLQQVPVDGLHACAGDAIRPFHEQTNNYYLVDTGLCHRVTAVDLLPL